MNIIEQMLTGEMEMSSFIYLLQSDKHIQNQLRSLVPQGAISNENHIFWKRISFDSLKKNNFDFVKFLYWLCRLDGTIADNLNIYETIRTAYSFSYADIEYTTSYEEAFDLYLDVVKDCCGYRL